MIKRVVDGDQITSSPNDKKSYRSLELENGVRVLLIHDPEIESAIKTPDSDTGHRKAAAAAVLNSGFAFDPDDMPGLSHLLEHMVFMGSKEYPGEAMYHEFINRHGGAHNAFTEPERTVFFFDIDPPAFMEALSRFASFFISPLLAHDSVEREVNAVQNEFSGRASHNMVRMAHVREAVVPDRTHPSSKFGCGNIETLWNAPRDAGISVRDRLVSHHRETFSSDRLCVAVQGGQSLDDLQDHIVALFSRVPRGEAGPPRGATAGTAYPGRPRVCWLNAVGSEHLLMVSFEWPSLRSRPEWYCSKSARYIVQLLEGSGPGSLLSGLKEAGLGDRISAYVQPQSWGDTIEVVVSLTEKGATEDCGLQALRWIFRWIRLLRELGPQEWLWQQQAHLSRIDFLHVEATQALNNVLDKAPLMRDVPAEHILDATHLYRDYKADEITELLEHMSPSVDGVCVVICSTSAFQKAEEEGRGSTKKERWMEIDYIACQVDDSQVKDWATWSQDNGILKLPPRNPYIPIDLSLCQGDEASPPAGVMFPAPTMVHDESGLRVWHRLTRAYRTPRAALMARLSSPAMSSSVQQRCLSLLVVYLAADLMHEELGLAFDAGMDVSFGIDNTTGWEVHVSGYSEHISLLARRVLEKIAAVATLESDELFGRVKDFVIRGLSSREMEPADQASVALRLLTNPAEVSSETAIDVLKGTTLEDLRKGIVEILACSHIEALALGSLSSDASVACGKELQETVRTVCQKAGSTFRPLPAVERPQKVEMLMPLGETTVTAMSKNPEAKTSAVTILCQLGPAFPSRRLRCLSSMLLQCLEQPLFDDLRTKQQLCYAVSASMPIMGCVTSMSFHVLSGTHCPSHLKAKTDEFLQGFVKTLEDMGEEEFERHRSSLINLCQFKPASAREEAQRPWDTMQKGQYHFYRFEQDAQTYRDMDTAQVVEFMKDYILPGGRYRRAAVITVVAPGMTDQESDVEEAGAVLERVARVRREWERVDGVRNEPPKTVWKPGDTIDK